MKTLMPVKSVNLTLDNWNKTPVTYRLNQVLKCGLRDLVGEQKRCSCKKCYGVSVEENKKGIQILMEVSMAIPYFLPSPAS